MGKVIPLHTRYAQPLQILHLLARFRTFHNQPQPLIHKHLHKCLDDYALLAVGGVGGHKGTVDLHFQVFKIADESDVGVAGAEIVNREQDVVLI